jgi:uncharacterized caspase-like protein
MCRFLQSVLLFVLLSLGVVATASAEPAEKRIALVIGNGDYKAGALRTAANDAGLVAQTLQAAGFDVIGARDLDQESLRRAFRDFLDKAAASGPDTVAFVYVSGYGLQLEGENYFLPVDAKILRAGDVAAEGVRLSDYLRPLGGLKLSASIFVLDAARKAPFAISGEPLAGGLALVEPGPGTLIAFNAAPGTIAPEQNSPYGAYAQALAEMIRAGNLSLRDLFDRVRLRVSDMTKGAQIPWNASRVEASFVFFEHSAEAPPPVAAADPSALPLAELGASTAYSAALERDTLEAYQEFLAAYPDDPIAKRVRAIVAARREAITWRQTYAVNTAQAYWSYLRRYPHGPHSADARRRLALRAFAAEAPASFTEIDYDVPPPDAQEQTYVDRPVLAFDDPEFGFVPPPPVPVYFLPPPPAEFIVLLEPLPVFETYLLPVPVFVPLPVWCHRPAYVVSPPANVIYENIHNRVIVDRATRSVTIRDRHDGFFAPTRPAHNAVALAPALPPSIARRTALVQPNGSAVQHGFSPNAQRGVSPNVQRGVSPNAQHGVSPQRSNNPALGQPLPGSHGHALPPLPPQSAFAHGGTIPARPEHALPTIPNARTLPTSPTLPHVTARPPLPSPTPSLPTRVRPIPPALTPHPAPTPQTTLRPTPPVQAARPLAPPSPAPSYRPPSPPAQAFRPPAPAPTIRPPSPPPAVYRPPAPPVVASRPPSPPPVFRAPPPAVHVAPPPVVRAAPPAPVFRAPPPAVHAAPPAAVRAAPPKRT